jgi:hypothetical protein
MQGFLRGRSRALSGPLSREELYRLVVHSWQGGGGCGEICGVAFLGAGVRQSQAAVSQWEGELVHRGAVQMGLRRDSKGAVHRFALGHQRPAYVLSCAALGQVRRALLEAAVSDKPAVLVPQLQCQELVHQMAGLRGVAVSICVLEGGVLPGVPADLLSPSDLLSTCFSKLIEYIVWCLCCLQKVVQFAIHCYPAAITVCANCTFCPKMPMSIIMTYFNIAYIIHMSILSFWITSWGVSALATRFLSTHHSS